ncbi:MAG: hypothetical protein HY909_17945 [Deltaproteobacteria bacterium]|nr:hypothetical protein [Deltaproteobacteria bacterium]
MEPLRIDLTDPGPHGLPPSKLADRCEVAAVVLEALHAERSPEVDTCLERGGGERSALLRWRRPDQLQRDANANKLKASEEGAEGVAFATVWRSDQYLVKMRAYHGSGADWLLHKVGAPPDAVVRLEVSGIVGEANAKTRLREKVQELRAGKLRRPGIALVVAFSEHPVRILLEDVP